MIAIANVQLRDFGRDDACPTIPTLVYHGRIEQTIERMRAMKCEFLVVYGDREHFANLAYLTGFDPRFEEAILLLAADGRKKLLVGNECMGYLPDVAALNIDVELFQELSLLGQPRSGSRSLRRILRDFGINRGKRVGCVGWKFFSDSSLACEIPAYVVDLLRELVGDRSRVSNATPIFMHPRDGLRLVCEPEQIAQFEHASCVTSDGVLRLLRHLRDGVEERDLEVHLDSRGLPLSCHRMIGFGNKAKRGLASASANRASLGDAFTTAFGVTGALTCRAGVIARNAKDLPAETADFYGRFAANYFSAVVAWYRRIKVGAVAGDVFAAVERARDKRLYDLAVNPGHYLHLDEWVNSPFAAGGKVRLQSGMALQMDIIPVSKGPFCYANAEDGVVLADERLQSELARRYPKMWSRMLRRRDFMREALGITLDHSVLPLSNIAGWLPPYALDLKRVFVKS